MTPPTPYEDAGIETETLPSAGGNTLDFTTGEIWISPEAASHEVLAARELQTYLYSISQKKLPVRTLTSGQTNGRPAIIVGTINSLPESITDDFSEQIARLEEGTDEAFHLKVGIRQGAPTALILANKPIGVLYGAYTFLEKLGIGFYLGGDVLPGTDISLHVAELDELWNPALPIRGCVIWYNFLNGPATWDLEDYQYFFDQMVKMKANLVSFPEYGHGFTNYLSDGKLVPGGPLPTSEWKHSSYNNTWGTVRGMKTAEFGFGTGEFFTGAAFGSKATLDATDEQDAIRRAQALFAQAVAYAQMRGINVSLGFQLDGLPDEVNLQNVEAKLRVLVASYPQIASIWFWQAEGATMRSDDASANSTMGDLIKECATHFGYLNDEHRAMEGGRMAVYFQQAYDRLKAIAPSKQVVISGWGGDQWFHFTDLFPGLDKALPKDIVFSALDNIDPTSEPHVSKFYGELPADRQRWPIPWWESDGGGTRTDQSMPQCNTRPFSVLLPDVLQKGCTGVLGIHWRTRAVEDVAAYMLDFAWKPATTTYESFWADFALRCFGKADAPEMTALLMELDALGPRWTGGSGQHECWTFSWAFYKTAPKEENLQVLQRIRQQLSVIAEHDRLDGQHQFLDRVERLINEIDWVVLFDDAVMQIRQAEAKSATADACADKPIWASDFEAEVKSTTADVCADNPIWASDFEFVGSTTDKFAAAEILRNTPLGQAMHAYTRLLYTQSDWGVLATVNVKMYAAFERYYQQCAVDTVPGAGEWDDIPIQVAFKEPCKIAIVGEPLSVQLVASGGRSIASVNLFYRLLGEGTFVAMPMTRGYKNVYQAVIPGSAVTDSGLEYYIEVRSIDDQLFRVPNGLPSIAVTVVE